jgi:TorA maturation chaperone TorD
MKDKYEELTMMQVQSIADLSDQHQADKARVELPNQLIDSALSEIDTHQQGTAAQFAESLSPEHQYRIGAYSMLAELLRQPPQQPILNRVTGLADAVEKKDDFAVAMSMLGLAARTATVNELDDEFHALFIGLGRGELVPYGSWYLTGFLMEKPLGVLRGDLAKLGFARSEGTCEPEDHVAALCEVMAMLIDEGRSLDQQKVFFEAHVAPWLGQFFTDLSVARSAVFYRAVARFGLAFFAFEKRYLAMSV